jgi:hypothetical protein
MRRRRAASGTSHPTRAAAPTQQPAEGDNSAITTNTSRDTRTLDLLRGLVPATPTNSTHPLYLPSLPSPRQLTPLDSLTSSVAHLTCMSPIRLPPRLSPGGKPRKQPQAGRRPVALMGEPHKRGPKPPRTPGRTSTVASWSTTGGGRSPREVIRRPRKWAQKPPGVSQPRGREATAPGCGTRGQRRPSAADASSRSWKAQRYVAVGGPNQVLSASASSGWVRSPTQATYPSGRINTAVGAVTAPSAGSSHGPTYLASII